MKIIYSEVFERMIYASNLENSTQVAKALNVSPQAISNYKKKGIIPSSTIVKFAEKFDLSVDWLLWEIGEKDRPGYNNGGANIDVCNAAKTINSFQHKHNTQSSKLMALNTFSPEELICIGKLLSALRSANSEETIKAIKYFLDGISKNTSFH